MSETPPIRIFLFATLVLAASSLHAQRDEDLAWDRPEAWAMKYFSAVSVMQGGGPPPGLDKGKWVLGFEIANIPRLDEEERTVGFNGTKEEDLNKAPVLARPLIHYGFTDRLSLTASYVPPFEVFDGLETHLAGLSANVILLSNDRLEWNIRLIGQWSEAKGDFTAPAEVVGNPDPEVNPFEAIAPSSDTYTSWTGTAESSLFIRLNETRTRHAYLTAAYTYGDYEFDVYVPQPAGNRHTRKLFADGSTWSLGGGLDFDINDRFTCRLGAVYAPLKVRRPPGYNRSNDSLLNFRFILNYRI